MAQKSTVFRAELNISDMDGGYYSNHTITIARHPSETDERMMMRVLAFIIYASDNLRFANGLSEPDEPDLWEKDYTGAIVRWIMVGLPDERQIKKACGRSGEVIIFAYGGSAVDAWWSSLSQGNKFTNLSVFAVPESASRKLASLVERSMQLQCSIQDGHLWLSSQDSSLEIYNTILKRM
jgi:uncharacterized protein YaeQ